MLFRGVLIVVLAVAVGAVIVSRLDLGDDDSAPNEIPAPTDPTPPFGAGTVPAGLHQFSQFDVPLSMVFSDGWMAAFPPDNDEIALDGPVFLAISHPSMVVDADSGEFVPAPEDLVAWVGTHKNLDASDPVETTLGGRAAFMIDATALEGTKTLAFNVADAILVTKSDRMRLIVTDVDSKTVTALMIASPADFDTRVAAGQALLDTLRFEVEPSAEAPATEEGLMVRNDPANR
jgi:hypothetical protein